MSTVSPHNSSKYDFTWPIKSSLYQFDDWKSKRAIDRSLQREEKFEIEATLRQINPKNNVSTKRHMLLSQHDLNQAKFMGQPYKTVDVFIGSVGLSTNERAAKLPLW